MDRSNHIIVLAICLGLFLLTAYSTASQDEGVPAVPDNRVTVAPVEASSLWIVVNLFGGRTSKQAEKVRDTLAALGAQGQGIVLPYKDISVENMIKLRPAFLALSPNGIPWCRYRGRSGEDLQDFFVSLKVIIEEMNIPVVGICGGHQALALAFGGKVAPIRGGEDDCLPYGNNPTERGRQDIQVVLKDPLFIGMGPSLNLVQNHYDEVKRLPAGFLCLAKNKLCPYQIIRHPSKPAYGIQAHTEYYLQSRPDGGTLLRNFLHIAAIHNRIARDPEFVARSRTVMRRQGSSQTMKTFW
ncbi:MAG: gamma-glutamyl-gamma-aminobutyrate hydrolase family protein [Pseudomonadota bacterium]